MFVLLHAPIVLGGRRSGVAIDVRGGKSVGCNGGIAPDADEGSGIFGGPLMLFPFLVGGNDRVE